MVKLKIKESPLFWPASLKKGVLFVLDETLIPEKLSYIQVRSLRDSIRVIKQMKTRAFGQFLVVIYTFLLEIGKHEGSDEKLMRRLDQCAKALNESRPTFPFGEVTQGVLGMARQCLAKHQDLRKGLMKGLEGYLSGIRFRRLERIQKIAALIKEGDSILTHCNVSGELAMAAAICRDQGKDIHFFATETRPYFQGAKLTTWELKRMGAAVTLIADNAVGNVMADELISKVIVGSDRSCANGDFANKIGTYQIAVLAEEFGIPLVVLNQPSGKIKKGSDIPIELRDEKELLKFEGKKIFKGRVRGIYPGFDVVPHQLVKKFIAINVN